MEEWTIGLIVFACVFGGAILGMVLRSRIPEAHLGDASKDAVKVGMGLVATMAALVLGLLVASAKNSYDEQRRGLDQISANLILLDSVLAQYGPATLDGRQRLRTLVATGIRRIWPADASQDSTLAPASTREGEHGARLIVSDAVMSALDDGAAGAPLGAVAVRGYAEPVRIWRIDG